MGPRRFDRHFWRTFPAVHCGFSGLTFQVGGVGLSATPTPGDAEPRTLNPSDLVFSKQKNEFSQVRGFRKKVSFPRKDQIPKLNNKKTRRRQAGGSC